MIIIVIGKYSTFWCIYSLFVKPVNFTGHGFALFGIGTIHDNLEFGENVVCDIIFGKSF